MKTRKKYTKPSVGSPNGNPHLVPALAVAEAIAAGYAVGRVAKKLFGRSDETRCLALRKVTA